MERRSPAEGAHEDMNRSLEREAELKARVSRLQELLKRKVEVLERKQETINQLRETSAKKTEAVRAARLRSQALRDGVSAVEADKGKLEQTYYDEYFAKLAQAEWFERTMSELRDELTQSEGQASARARDLLEQLAAETPIQIPS